MNEKIVKKIDTDTYNKITNTVAIASTCSFFAGELLQSSYVDASIISYIISLLGYYETILLSTNINKEYTTDGIKVLKLYREFIKNYSRLNKIFFFDNPVEVFTLYNYLYTHGYLSKDRSFKYDLEAKTNNIGALMGTSVIAGRGVCRHISGLLSDIMNEAGMPSTNLAVYSNTYHIATDTYKLSSQKEEKSYEWLKENILDMITSSNKEECHTIIVNMDTNIASIIGGNHAITYVKFNDMNYYLDPTAGIIFRKNPIDNKLYSSNEVLKIKRAGAKLIVSDRTKYKELFNESKKYTTNITKEEERIIVAKTAYIIKNNLDIFDHFYNDNRELYDEIAYKTLRLK